jgi:FKBP-type peptidyl-prolyl cis-trans isomerase SlyD
MAIENNQKVSMTYQLTVDGEVIDSNIGLDDLVFEFGAQQIIPGLESRIQDMNVGESRDNIVIPPSEAYGEPNPDAKQVLTKEQCGDLELEVGMMLQAQGSNGEPIQIKVHEIHEDRVVMDLNHPLAGKELSFNVVINSID